MLAECVYGLFEEGKEVGKEYPFSRLSHSTDAAQTCNCTILYYRVRYMSISTVHVPITTPMMTRSLCLLR